MLFLASESPPPLPLDAAIPDTPRLCLFFCVPLADVVDDADEDEVELLLPLRERLAKGGKHDSISDTLRVSHTQSHSLYPGGGFYRESITFRIFTFIALSLRHQTQHNTQTTSHFACAYICQAHRLLFGVNHRRSCCFCCC